MWGNCSPEASRASSGSASFPPAASSAAFAAALSPAAAAPLLVFCLLYTPCIAAVASVKRELGNKWAVIMVVNQCAVAWLCALLVRLAAVALF